MAAITHRAQHWKVGIKDAVGKLVYENRLLAGHIRGVSGTDYQKKRKSSKTYNPYCSFHFYPLFEVLSF
jgi:hypothetical protein